MRSTHYKYAAYLESIGDVLGAIRHYEKSNTHRHEVPRMLFELGEVDNLRKYVHAQDDPALYKWWGQYCESNNEFEAAIQYYKKAEDHLSRVRIFCHTKNFESACDVVETTGDKAASYYLARQFELRGEPEHLRSAMHYFQKSGRYNHAVRLAQQKGGMDDELVSLSLMSSPAVQLRSAKYFEAKGAMPQAVQLYQRAGRLAKAMDLCFHAQLFDELRIITADIGTPKAAGGKKADPQTLARCGAFFMEHGQYDKAVQLFVTGGQIQEAVDAPATKSRYQKRWLIR